LKVFPVYGADGAVPRIADPEFTVGFGLSTASSVDIVEE
jgi:hypothetical protein